MKREKRLSVRYFKQNYYPGNWMWQLWYDNTCVALSLGSWATKRGARRSFERFGLTVFERMD